MKPAFKISKNLVLLISALFIVSSCGKKTTVENTEVTLGNLAPRTLDRTPTGDVNALENQLKRFEGQKNFLNPGSSYNRFDRMSSRAEGESPAMDPKGTGENPRDIQESDVFKVGSKDSKLLYLLNNYRGLQVVSFDKGADKPRLLGRTAARGNWSSQMYHDLKKSRLIALENNYDQKSRKYSGHLVFFDVEDSSNPEISQTIQLNGNIVDSRMVGKILYVVTQVRNQNGNIYPGVRGNNNSNNEQKAIVYAYNLEDKEVKKVSELAIKGTLDWGEKMNIVETVQAGKYSYYLISVLRGGDFSWRNGQNILSVVDISDADGKIKDVMKVELKGRINERSQAFIKDGTLVSVSNYNINGTIGRRTIRRISVETFRFPKGDGSEVIDKEEADYRFYQLKKALAEKKKSLTGHPDDIEDALNAYRDTLISGTAVYKSLNLKLKGKFIKEEDGLLRKLYADTEINTGSTTGLSANIQDVRTHGDLLYVYWVPQNNIDPLDVFDISDLTDGIEYKGRLEFDGWIERSKPLTYKGTKYIVGLGYQIPAVNNNRNRRYPHMMLFKVTQSAGGKVKKEIVSEVVMNKGRVWANFNAADKMIEIKFDKTTGKGSILFGVYQFDNGRYASGGKIIGFDINKDNDTDFDDIFQVGGFIKAQSGWLKRVFHNPELDMINTFSDMSLGTFKVDLNSGRSDAASVYSAISTLELARNIQAFVTLPINDLSTKGLQIINSNRSWYYGGADSKTIIRMVNVDGVDAELGDVLRQFEVKGQFQSGFLDKEAGSYIFKTYAYDNVSKVSSNYLHIVKGGITKDLNGLSITSYDLNLLAGTRSTNSYYSNREILKLKNGKLMVSHAGQFFTLTHNKIGAKIDKLNTTCTVNGVNTSRSIMGLDGKIFVVSEKQVLDPRFPKQKLNHRKHFLHQVVVTGNKAVCGAGINIPGKPISLHGDNLITKDQQLVDIYVKKDELGAPVKNSYPQVISKLALSSIKVNLTAGVLKDVLDAEGISLNGIKSLSDGSLLYFETAKQNNNIYPYYRGGIEFEMSDMRRPWNPRPNYNGQNYAHYINMNNYDFHVDSYLFDSSLTGLSLNKLFADKVKVGSYKAVISSGRKVQVLEFSLKDRRPVVKKLLETDVKGNKSVKAVDFVTLPSYMNYRNAVNYNEENKSMEFAQNLYGVAQVYLK